MSLVRPLLLFSIAIGVLSVQSGALAANAVAPSVVIGKFGFGYGPNLMAKCAPITEKLARKFDKCTWEQVEPSSYAQKANYYTCEITKTDDEYKIYPSKSRCSDELGTMKANAP